MNRIFGAALAIVSLLAASGAQAQNKTLVIGMGSADAGKLDPHIASTTPDKGPSAIYIQRTCAPEAWPDQSGGNRARPS